MATERAIADLVVKGAMKGYLPSKFSVLVLYLEQSGHLMRELIR